MADRLTSQELAEWLGVSARTLETWRAAGMPYLARGGGAPHLHDTVDVVEWLRATDREGWIPLEADS